MPVAIPPGVRESVVKSSDFGVCAGADFGAGGALRYMLAAAVPSSATSQGSCADALLSSFIVFGVIIH